MRWQHQAADQAMRQRLIVGERIQPGIEQVADAVANLHAAGGGFGVFAQRHRVMAAPQDGGDIGGAIGGDQVEFGVAETGRFRAGADAHPVQAQVRHERSRRLGQAMFGGFQPGEFGRKGHMGYLGAIAGCAKWV